MSLLAASLILASGAAFPALQSKTEMSTGSNIPIPRRARIPDDPDMSKRVRGRVVMSEFARCTIDRNAYRLEAVLALADGGGFGRAAHMLITDECLDGGQIKFKTRALRGPIFAELYRRKADAAAKGRNWGPAIAKINLAAVPENDAFKQHLALLAFADCVVRSERAMAEAVVIAPVASKAQNAAIAAIAPKLGACLPQGSQVRLGKEQIEGGLAEVLYRGVEPRPEPASGTTAEVKP